MEDTVESKVTLLSNKRNELDQQRCVGEAEEDGAIVEVLDSHPDKKIANEYAMINKKEGSANRSMMMDNQSPKSTDCVQLDEEMAIAAYLHHENENLACSFESMISEISHPFSEKDDGFRAMMMANKTPMWTACVQIEKELANASKLQDKNESLVGSLEAMITVVSHPLPKIDYGFTEEAADLKVTLSPGKRLELDQQPWVGKDIEDGAIIKEFDCHPNTKTVDQYGVTNGEKRKASSDEKRTASRGTMAMNLSPASTACLRSNSADLSLDDLSTSDIPSSKNRDDITSMQISTELKKIVLEKTSISRSELGTESSVVVLLDKNETLVGNFDATISKNGHPKSGTNDEDIDTVNSIQLTREDAKIKIRKIEDFAALHAEVKWVELDEQNWVDGNEEGGSGVKGFVSNRDFNSVDRYLDQKESRHNTGGAITIPRRRIHDELIVRFRDRAAAQEEQYSNSSSSLLTGEDTKIKIGNIENFAALHADVKRMELDELNWVDGNEEGGSGAKGFVSNLDFNSADRYLDQKESRHNAGGAITNPQRRIHDDLLVRFRDRAASQEEQYSNSSSSSKSYEDFLSFAAAPSIHGEGRTLSEELSSPTTAPPQVMKDNAVKMLSKLWNRKSRRAV
jgi:hypothetical protein